MTFFGADLYIAFISDLLREGMALVDQVREVICPEKDCSMRQSIDRGQLIEQTTAWGFVQG